MNCRNYFVIAGAVAVLGSFKGCKEFVTVERPPNSITNEFVFSNERNATSAVLSIYSKIMESSKALSGGFNGISAIAGLASDELTNYSNGAALLEVYTVSLLQNNAIARARWTEIYKVIYDANSVVEGLGKSTQVQESVRKQLTGEAKFIRAFSYFYLTNLYGDVPLLLTTDYRENSIASRTKQSVVYQQIISDLNDARSSLPESYLTASNAAGLERVRANRYSAEALLARVYLYVTDWSSAERAATRVIDNKILYDTVPLPSVFLANSKETILQFQPVQPGTNSFDAPYFVLTTAPSPSSVLQNTALSKDLLDSFEPGDKRKSVWISSILALGTTYYYPSKYKVNLGNQPVSEYPMVLRLAEVYLIRAEARIRQGNISEGIQDINLLRRRSRAQPTIANPDPLPEISFNISQEQAMLAVENERRHELFSEWGDRWFDLKRTGRVDMVLATIKGKAWQSTDRLWPIPLSEILLNGNLTPQNIGYD